jgi:hypothetical protein
VIFDFYPQVNQATFADPGFYPYSGQAFGPKLGHFYLHRPEAFGPNLANFIHIKIRHLRVLSVVLSSPVVVGFHALFGCKPLDIRVYQFCDWI